nr:immunoglobulin light chain junction region [Macaca mulatta]MOV71969.1 immunoglobulin light chain junction region [Macaca mulatta]
DYYCQSYDSLSAVLF